MQIMQASMANQVSYKNFKATKQMPFKALENNSTPPREIANKIIK